MNSSRPRATNYTALPLGEALGKLLAQLAPPGADRIYVTFGGQAQKLPNTDPVTRSILRGFLESSAVKDVNNVNVRSVAASLGLTVEEKKSDEPVTFNEWVHVQVFSNGKSWFRRAGPFSARRTTRALCGCSARRWKFPSAAPCCC